MRSVALLLAVAFATIAAGAPQTATHAQATSTLELLAGADRELLNGRGLAASALYRDALTAGDGSLVERAWTGLVRALRASGEPEAAALHARMLLRHDPLDPDRARYLLAAAALEGGAVDSAALAYRTVEASGGLLAPVAHVRAAQALEAGSRDVEAVAAHRAAITNPALPGGLRMTARIAAIDVLMRLDRVEEALEAITALAYDPAATASQIASARWLATVTRRDRDDSTWRFEAAGVLVASPDAPETLLALQALEADGVESDPLLTGYLRYRAGDGVAAAEAFRRGLDAPLNARETGFAWFYLGVVAGAAGNDEQAIAAYAQALEYAPENYLADDAHWERARALERGGRYREAAAEFALLVERLPGSPFARAAAIDSALALARAGDSEAGEQELRALVEGAPPDLAARAARWLAVLDLAVLDTDGAPLPSPADHDRTSIAALLHDAGAAATAPLPASALGEWRTHEIDWLEAELWVQSTFGGRPVDLRSFVGGSEHTLALALTTVDEHRLARELLRDLARRGSREPHNLLELARAAYEADLYDIASDLAEEVLSRLSPDVRLTAPWTIAQLAYPASFEAIVLDAASKAGIPPLLLSAVVRQESSFNRWAASPAGARGLMQIMPATGEAIARSLGVAWAPDQLMQPETALRFGAHYLAAQLDRFDGDLLAALAAYNGGGTNAQRWLDEQWWPGPDGYIEAIDFPETQHYLERVLEAYALYRHFYLGLPYPALR